MHTIIISGTPWCKLEYVQQILMTAGLSPALSTRAGSLPDINTWYDHLFLNRPASSSKALKISRSWELAASQIFMSNWEQSMWGWADYRSTWLLEFWRDFDANTKFVLLYTPAVTALAGVLTDRSEVNFDAKFVLDQWCIYQTELLRFFHRNPERCIIVDVRRLSSDPVGIIRRINDHFQLKLSTELDSLPFHEEKLRLVYWLAQQLLELHPAAQSLDQEIQASLPDYESTINSLLEDDTMVELAAEQLRQLYRQVAELLLSEQQNQAQLVALSDQILKQKQQHQTLQNQNVMLQLQLHEAQEDIELNFLQCQNLMQKNIELLQAQDAARQGHEDALLVQSGTLIAQHDEKVQVLQQQLSQMMLTMEAQEQAKAKSTEYQFITEQLHRTQEELEHYFSQNQQNIYEKQVLQARWDRFLSHFPDYCTWDSIEIVDDSQKSPRWIIKGLHTTGIDLPPIVVGIDLDEEQPALLIDPPRNHGEMLLLNWPHTDDSFNAQTLRLQPGSAHTSAAMRTLRRLTSTDLRRIQNVCNALLEWLTAQQPDGKLVLQQLQKLRSQFEQLPATWRFDHARLKNEQINPNYEHLSICLQNASYGHQHWSQFEFRLGAANIEEGKFSVLPRVEFPLPVEGKRQFENWFNEVGSKQDPRFELRFDVKANAIDIQAWRALSPKDQMQMLSILGALPRILNQLEQQETAISRAWNDWQQLVTGMQKTMQSLGLPTSTFEVV